SVSLLPPLRAPLFPYTTLFRSVAAGPLDAESVDGVQRGVAGLQQPLLQQLAELDLLAAFIHFAFAQHHGLLDQLDQVGALAEVADRKSTRLNSSHVKISYAVFC